MIQWEYAAPYIYGALEVLMAELDRLGREGWEVIQINATCSDGGQRVFIKRLLQPESPVLLPDGFDLRPGAVNRVS